MKRFTYLAAVAAIALGGAGAVTWANAAEEESEAKAVVEGQMVDMKCYVAMGMGGGGQHLKCALKCAESGIPVGVVDTSLSQVVTVLAPAPALAKYMGQTVRITGMKAANSTAIVPERLEIWQDDKWVAGELPASMM